MICDICEIWYCIFEAYVMWQMWQVISRARLRLRWMLVAALALHHFANIFMHFHKVIYFIIFTCKYALLMLNSSASCFDIFPAVTYCSHIINSFNNSKMLDLIMALSGVCWTISDRLLVWIYSRTVPLRLTRLLRLSAKMGWQNERRGNITLIFDSFRLKHSHAKKRTVFTYISLCLVLSVARVLGCKYG